MKQYYFDIVEQYILEGKIVFVKPCFLDCTDLLESCEQCLIFKGSGACKTILKEALNHIKENHLFPWLFL